MLKKLMKYEFKATGRTILPLYGGLLIFAILVRILYSNFAFSQNSFGKLAVGLSIFIYGFIMAAVFVATFFLIVQRFHKNLLGDEGYLMQTLPVSTSKNILSKLITSSVWSIVSCIIALLSILILVINGDIINAFSNQLIPAIQSTVNQIGVMTYVFSLELLIASILQLTLFVLKLYAAISIGHLFNSSKILLSIVAFIALSTIEGFITSNFFIGFNYIFGASSFSPSNFIYDFNCFFLVSIAINLIYSTAYFFITNYILKNKLNLE